MKKEMNRIIDIEEEEQKLRKRIQRNYDLEWLAIDANHITVEMEHTVVSYYAHNDELRVQPKCDKMDMVTMSPEELEEMQLEIIAETKHGEYIVKKFKEVINDRRGV
jgi:hypothetical protein